MTKLSRVAVVLVLAAGVAGCCKSEDKKSGEPAGTATVTTTGAQDWHGDTKACAAVKACCTASELGLFCALSKASSEGDCGKALPSIRSYVKEAKVAPPAGCM